ncbi:MAG: DUF4388 domain-containing protein [Deltaproteobacteria bacterium]|nr:DUF4388 domain-containing protein [Deltaproteobacteria bacterium]
MTHECICLNADVSLIEELTVVLSSIDFGLTPIFPQQLGDVRRAALTASLAVAELPDEHTWDRSFSRDFRLHHFSFPPLVVIVPRRASAAHYDRLRHQGVAAVLERPLSAKTVLAELRPLLKARRWMTGRLEQMSLADILQNLAAGGTTAEVTLVPDNVDEISARPADAPGGIGRVYLREGRVVVVEYEGARGMTALASVLGLTTGSFRVHAHTLRPRDEDMSETVFDALVKAAVIADERNRNQTEPDFMAFDADEIKEALREAKTAKVQPEHPTVSDRFNAQTGGRISASASGGARADARADARGVAGGRDSLDDRPLGGASPTGSRALETNWETPMRETLDLPPGLRAIKNRLDGLTGYAESDLSGGVLRFSGTIDAETTCAIAAMNQSSAEQIGQTFGFSGLRAWAISTEAGSCYVNVGAEGLKVLTGPREDNLASKLNLILTALRDEF